MFFTFWVSFNPCANLLFLSPFTEQETGSETLSNFFKITQQVSRKAQTKPIYAFFQVVHTCIFLVNVHFGLGRGELFPEFHSVFPKNWGAGTHAKFG